MSKKKKDDVPEVGEGKKRPPTEVEREELRVRITALEEKLAHATQELERVLQDHVIVQEKLKEQQKNQMDVVAYLNKEIEKKDAELSTLMERYVQLRGDKDAEEARLKADRDKALQDGKTMGEANEKSMSEVRRLTDQLIDYERLKQQSIDDSAEKATLKRTLQEEQSTLEETRKQLTILAAPEGENVGDDGQGAVLLLLLEAMRMYSSKLILHEQASYEGS